MNSIHIPTEFADDRVTRAAGERLRRLIMSRADDSRPLEIDFDELVIASTSFFDEGFAKLAQEGWTRAHFESRLVLTAMNKFDRRVLERVLGERFE